MQVELEGKVVAKRNGSIVTGIVFEERYCIVELGREGYFLLLFESTVKIENSRALQSFLI